jgi:hypothetical protein
MNDFLKGIGIGLLLAGFIGFIAAMTFSASSEANGYKRGQIDALSGNNIKYHLVVNSDSSRTWQEIPERWGR